MNSYRLVNKIPVLIDNIHEINFLQEDRVVVQEKIEGYLISTVFLGFDHAFNGGDPLLFETMIFKDDGSFQDLYGSRCSTWDSAEKMHEKAKEWLREKIKRDSLCSSKAE